MPYLIFLAGPTCVGKSGVALRLAKDIDAEIISCDSMQVYKGMDIGTAKPSKKEQKIIPHHMIDVVSLSQEYDVAQYVKDANKAITSLHKKNKVPLITGGTGLYMKALIDGLFSGPSRDEGIRIELEKRVEMQGLSSLYDELKKIDPAGADKIKPQDKRRIIRALEVYYTSGKPISSFQTQWGKLGGEEKNIIIGLDRKREDLYERIEKRVDKMFENGLVQEVEELAKNGLLENKTARQAVGYKEIIDFVDGKASLEQTKELIKRNTRRLAKRQLTWFRKDVRVGWVLVQRDEAVDITVQRIRDLLCKKKELY